MPEVWMDPSPFLSWDGTKSVTVPSPTATSSLKQAGAEGSTQRNFGYGFLVEILVSSDIDDS